ncbi:hypothetical protein PHAVU_011G074600 [Phaseolus vulgaris]|uniref:FAS1 domain-containing protein n=1 Tax=Phaseolus vulgaris TaxID=3885 RepID=V7AG19_PHAVU|nr:hypothetical protein PHAVU_011G074600g [Phaseolus vulgaris]ESW04195.1 hypothetical protein PHAVU_011G074600g [Phaseolus vulgaris]
MVMQHSLFLCVSLVLVVVTTSAQHSPAASPSIPRVAQSPLASPSGMNTVPLVPVSPDAAPSPATPKAATFDIAQILSKAKRFSVLIRLLKTTQLINQLNSQLLTSDSGGLTILSPPDSAFSKLKGGFLNSLNDRQKVELLQFHTLSSFLSISNFDTLTNPVQTQAGDDPKRLQLNITTYGGSHVSMSTGAVNATITGTVYTDKQLAIYEVDKVLLPLDVVLPKPKAPAPKPHADRSGDSNKNMDDDSGVPVEASGGCMNFYSVHVKWMSFVVLMGGAMICM